MGELRGTDGFCHSENKKMFSLRDLFTLEDEVQRPLPASACGSLSPAAPETAKRGFKDAEGVSRDESAALVAWVLDRREGLERVSCAMWQEKCIFSDKRSRVSGWRRG
jgi:hypothetical protein